MVWAHAPHIPFVGPKYYRGQCIAGTSCCPPGLNPNIWKDAQKIDYYSSICAMDAQVGNIRKLLLDLGVRDNTMLWFLSDNGPESSTPGSSGGLKGRKHSLFEGGHRVPGILEWPHKITSNIATKFPVTTTDILPTTLDAIYEGMVAEGFDSFDGMSIIPFINGSITIRPKPIVLQGEYFSSKIAVIDNNYKYHGSMRAYTNLDTDPTERKYRRLRRKSPPAMLALRSFVATTVRGVKSDYQANCPRA